MKLWIDFPIGKTFMQGVRFYVSLEKKTFGLDFFYFRGPDRAFNRWVFILICNSIGCCNMCWKTIRISTAMKLTWANGIENGKGVICAFPHAETNQRRKLIGIGLQYRSNCEFPFSQRIWSFLIHFFFLISRFLLLLFYSLLFVRFALISGCFFSVKSKSLWGDRKISS